MNVKALLSASFCLQCYNCFTILWFPSALQSPRSSLGRDNYYSMKAHIQGFLRYSTLNFANGAMSKKMRDELKMNFSSIYLQFKLDDKKCRLQRHIQRLSRSDKNNESCSLYRDVRKSIKLQT